MRSSLKSLSLFVFYFWSISAFSLICSVSATTLKFDGYHGEAARRINGKITLKCNGPFLHVEVGLAPDNGTNSFRVLKFGRYILHYNLYKDPDYKFVWGDRTRDRRVEFAKTTQPYEVTRPVYGLLFADQKNMASKIQYIDHVHMKIYYRVMGVIRQ